MAALRHPAREAGAGVSNGGGIGDAESIEALDGSERAQARLQILRRAPGCAQKSRSA